MKREALEKKRRFLRYLCIAIIVSLGNLFFYSYKVPSYLLVVCEALILLFCLCKKRTVDYVTYYLIFVCLGFEFADFLEYSEFYSLKNIRLLGINLGVWFLIPLFIYLLIYPIPIGRIKCKYSAFYFGGKYILLMNGVAAVVGVLLIAFNDNNIRSMDGWLKAYIGTAYTQVYLLVAFFLIFIIMIQTNEREINNISLSLQAVLWACVVQMVVAVVFGLYGTYGGTDILVSSMISFMVPWTIILSFDAGIVFPKINFIFGVIGIYCCLRYGANGKSIISAALALVVIYIYLIRKKKYCGIALIGGVLVVLALPSAISLLKTNILFSSKLDQVIGLVSFWKDDWLKTMPPSPQMRVTELLNVFMEYLKKPHLFIFGKGYLGTIKDYINMFGTSQTNTGSFSLSEWENGTFYALHEGANYLLMYGLCGVGYIGFLIKTVKNKGLLNPWNVIGIYWFCLLYGYSYTLGVFGTILFYYMLVSTDLQWKKKEDLI